MTRKDIYLVISNIDRSEISLLIDKLKESKISFSDYRYKYIDDNLVVHLHIDDINVKQKDLEELFKDTDKGIYIEVNELKL